LISRGKNKQKIKGTKSQSKAKRSRNKKTTEAAEKSLKKMQRRWQWGTCFVVAPNTTREHKKKKHAAPGGLQQRN